MVTKVIAGRFSKARLLRDLQNRRETLQFVHGINPNNGTRQLNCKNVENTKLRAIAYGEWEGIETIIRLIESGKLGYGD